MLVLFAILAFILPLSRSFVHIPLHPLAPSPFLTDPVNLTTLFPQLQQPALYTHTDRVIRENRLYYAPKPTAPLMGNKACAVEGKNWFGKIRLGGQDVRSCVDFWSADLLVNAVKGEKGTYDAGKSKNYTQVHRVNPTCYFARDTYSFALHLPRVFFMPEKPRREYLNVTFLHCAAPPYSYSVLDPPAVTLGIAPVHLTQHGTTLLKALSSTVSKRITFTIASPQTALLTFGESPIPHNTASYTYAKTSNHARGPYTVLATLGIGRSKHLLKNQLFTVDPFFPGILLPRHLAEIFYVSYPGAYKVSELDITAEIQSLALSYAKKGFDLYAVPCLNPATFVVEINGRGFGVEGRGGKLDRYTGYCLGQVVGGWGAVLGAGFWIGREGILEQGLVGVRDLTLESLVPSGL